MAIVCCLGLIMNCSLWWDNIMISMNAIISVKWHWSAWNLTFLTSWWHRPTVLWFIYGGSGCIAFQTIFRSMAPHAIQIYPTKLWATLWHLFQARSIFCRKTIDLIVLIHTCNISSHMCFLFVFADSILVIFVLLLCGWLSSYLISVHRRLFRFTFDANILSRIEILYFVHHLIDQLIFFYQILFLLGYLFFEGFNSMVLVYQFQLQCSYVLFLFFLTSFAPKEDRGNTSSDYTLVLKHKC